MGFGSAKVRGHVNDVEMTGDEWDNVDSENSENGHKNVCRR